MTSTLVLGGARSGKSRHAESLATGKRIYIATAEVFDKEMLTRVEAHKLQRGDCWHTIEAPLDLVAAISENDGIGRSILVDCLTVWLGNLMHHGRDALPEIDRLSDLLPTVKCKLLLVSNEVGQGIVPDNAIARQFRDLQGRCNQVIAAACSEVVLVVAGIPMTIKAPERR